MTKQYKNIQESQHFTRANQTVDGGSQSSVHRRSQSQPALQSRPSIAALTLGLASLCFALACTPPCRFNAEENCDDPMGEVIVGEVIEVVPGENLTPKVIDLLVMAPVDQSVIGRYYGEIIDSVLNQLSRYQISVAHAAIAPMYRRLNTETPILFGTPDEEAEFMSYHDAFEYFSTEEGLLPLDNEVDSDGQNLLQLGARLGTAAPYHPRQGSEGSRYLFREPQDGLLVLWINPFARRCTLNECSGADGSLASALTAQNEAGEATWLSLGGQGRLPLRKIVHAFIATEETNDEDGFFERCSNRIGLPARILDHIEPSSNELYKELTTRLNQSSLASSRIDFCQAVSDEGFDVLENVALKTRQSVQ